MQTQEKIHRMLWTHFEGVRDVIVANVLAAMKDGKVKVEEGTQSTLLTLIQQSMSEGYHRGFHVFERELSAVLTTPDVPQPVKTDTKKK